MDDSTLGIFGSGNGGVEEMVEYLANDEVQYCLFRIQIEPDGSSVLSLPKNRDIFMFWSGPNVDMTERGKKRIHEECVQKILCVSYLNILLK